MDIQRAFDILEIDLKDIKLTNITHEYIRKKYHKLALINHPDKKGNKLKFQEINEAYEYLLKELPKVTDFNSKTYEQFVSSSEGKSPTNKYKYLLSCFIESIVKGNYREIIKRVIKEIVIEYKQVSLETIFEELDKESALEVYSFIFKYKHILYISNETLDFVSLIIKQKYKNDRIFILNPSLKDILYNNIFKLYVDDHLYLVPLWHNELYFDAPDGSEIIVLCQPKLGSNINIDENNNIYYETSIKVDINLIKNEKFVSIEIGEKWFTIPLNKLYIKEEQIYIFKEQGIAQIPSDQKDIYNVSNKGDIIVKIRLI